MIRFFLAVALVFSALLSQAQPSNGGPTPGTPATAVPLDGGASLLLASGVAYGLRRLRQRHKAQH